MPRQRIPINYTLLFKVHTVDDWQETSARGESRKAFAKNRGISRPTLQHWERQIGRLREEAQRRHRADPFTQPVSSRGIRLTLSGSGRRSVSAPIEDALCTLIKDERRLEHTVTIDSIIDMATELMPIEIGAKSYEPKKSWCARIMKRNGLTIRRISHSGRKTCEELETLRLAFVEEVIRVVVGHCPLELHTGLTATRTVSNMDQTSVYWGIGKRSTAVPSTTTDVEGFRCTMALTVSADGRILPPHFNYNGITGGSVESQVNAYFTGEVATFSVQDNAWFDDRVMKEWIERCCKHIVCEPSVLILDSLSVHKKADIADALACTGTCGLYVPGGCTGVAQPLDIGVMAPFKQHIRLLNSTRSRGRPKTVSSKFRRRAIFAAAMDGLRCVSADTVSHAFIKAGPFVPFGPPIKSEELSPSVDTAAHVLEEVVL